ncbi:hypothetical protein AGIG_G9723 [Arapaima gigas]
MSLLSLWNLRKHSGTARPSPSRLNVPRVSVAPRYCIRPKHLSGNFHVHVSSPELKKEMKRNLRKMDESGGRRPLQPPSHRSPAAGDEPEE